MLYAIAMGQIIIIIKHCKILIPYLFLDDNYIHSSELHFGYSE